MLPALVLSVLAIVLAIIGLSREPTAPAPVPPEGEPLVVTESRTDDARARYRYWAFARAVEAGAELTDDDLVEVSAGQAVPGAVGTDTPLAGQTVRRNVRAGELVSGFHLEAGGALANALLPGFRAMALPVDEVSGVGGLLEPGDMVDVLATFRDAADQRGEPSAMVLMRNVELLAVGGLLQGAEPDPAARDRRARTSTVVLAVPEQSVPRLMLAAANGSLRLSAVSAIDMADTEGSEDIEARIKRVAVQPGEGLVRYRELFPAPPPPPRAAPRPRGQQVEMIEGSETRSVNVRP
ncbi:Flp pilus assembly protein CpaB [Isoalcanivorax indicus]|uniref:Flp pilus assembly protein CpaB n=1 Tax=Isoalcanivorax indicus TaxID=2202653 RepID=UPI0013C40AD3|nr:Flp pilus assembly protein CpaB [Isoalcanivorax indicus]